MTRVTFANGRDWRDEMIEDGDLAPGSISNHLKITNALFNFGLDNTLDLVCVDGIWVFNISTQNRLLGFETLKAAVEVIPVPW